MATTSVSIGPLTYMSPERDDQKASKVIEYYLKAYGLWSENDTNLQRIAKYDQHIHAVHAVDVAQGYYASLKREKAIAAAQAELDDLKID